MKKARCLVDHMFTADAAAHVFNGRFYIYPSHDIESCIPENDNGDHFDMLGFAEVPRDVVILDKEGKPLTGVITTAGFLKPPGCISTMANTTSPTRPGIQQRRDYSDHRGN